MPFRFVLFVLRQNNTIQTIGCLNFVFEREIKFFEPIISFEFDSELPRQQVVDDSTSVPGLIQPIICGARCNAPRPLRSRLRHRCDC